MDSTSLVGELCRTTGLKLVKSNSDSKADSKSQIGRTIQIEKFEIRKSETDRLEFTLSCMDKNTKTELWRKDFVKELSASKQESIDEILMFL